MNIYRDADSRKHKAFWPGSADIAGPGLILSPTHPVCFLHASCTVVQEACRGRAGGVQEACRKLSGKERKLMRKFTNKTKIICTIGPSTDSTEMMVKMLESGMNIARLNYAHGDFNQHAKVIKRLRAAARKTGLDVTIMADLPGPKIRIGQLKQDSIILHPKDRIILTTEQITGDWNRVSVTLPQLPKAVRKGDIIFLNDGLIQLRVISVISEDIACEIVVGGELRSNKGLNLPDTDLGISAFTPRDAECLRSALENGVDAVSQSFVNGPEDIQAVRKAASDLGFDPFIIAKMERSGALTKIDEILQEADGMMIARGDLGVEIPIERLAIVQKRLISRANFFGKPVITATQMLESMVRNPRPTRAEATDVANAVLDGTDCIMLSEESAIGKYPLDAIQTLAKISAYTEDHRKEAGKTISMQVSDSSSNDNITAIMAEDVYHAVECLRPELLIAHTVTGHTARMISRLKPSVRILAVSTDLHACRGMQFSYGVDPFLAPKIPKNWKSFIKKQIRYSDIKQGIALLVEVPSPDNPNANHRIDIFSDLGSLTDID